MVVVICVSGAVASTFSNEFSGMFKPFMGGIVDGKVTEVMDVHSAGPNALTDAEKQDTYTVSYAALSATGLNESICHDLAMETAAQTSAVGTQLSGVLSNLLCGRMTYALLFIIVFTLLSIILAVVGNLINVSFGIPGLNRIDKIVGAVLGAVRGVALILVIACVARYACVLIGSGRIEDTIVLELIVKTNPIAAALGI